MDGLKELLWQVYHSVHSDKLWK